LEGQFSLVVWENNTQPIIGGREETGVPKIFADIQDLHIFPPKHFTNASYEGNTFLRLEMVEVQPIEGQPLENVKAASLSLNNLNFRFIPKVGCPGVELGQPVLYPQGTIVKNAWMGKGTVEWIKLRPEQNPSQFHIIDALADLPIIKMAQAMMIKGEIIMKPFAGRVLE
jgi:acetoacetate decarboxylase